MTELTEQQEKPIWDIDLQSAGLPSNMIFGFGSEFRDTIHRFQKPGSNVRWCVFTVDRNHYVIKQEKVNNEWLEVWTKQMNKDLAEAKQYCEVDFKTGTTAPEQP